MFSGRSSPVVGFAAAGISSVIGVVYGAIAGYFGGWVDAFMLRVVDVFFERPDIFLGYCARGYFPKFGWTFDLGAWLNCMAGSCAVDSR
jgi:ABC-type dipeptide/oligopeptide/nickel transport system permease subunit